MIDLIISATVGAIAGSAIMRRIDLRKMAEAGADVAAAEANRDHWLAQYDRVRKDIEKYVSVGSYQSRQRLEAEAAHARAADALATKQARIDRALACETPKAAHGVKKMARLLRGEEA